MEAVAAGGNRDQVAIVMCGGSGSYPDVARDDMAFDNSANLVSPCTAYQNLLEDSDSEFLIYLHDDVTIESAVGWRDLVVKVFLAHKDCVVVGLGGAPRLGHPDLYKRPYNIWDMARSGYVSNQTDWQTHGGREQGMRRVAVVDAFCMAVRTSWLKSIGGWPVEHLSHHCLDLWICLEAARRRKEVWMIGIPVLHSGGGSSTKPAYEQATWLQGGTLASDHQAPHAWLYDQYRDVLPLMIL